MPEPIEAAQEPEKAPTLAEIERLDAVLGPSENESAADTMRAALEEFSGDEPASKPVDTTEAPRSDNRDEKGRFTAKDKAEEADKTDDTAEETVVVEVEGDADKEADTETDIEPPTEWTAEQQDAFRQLPKELKDFTLNQAKAASEGIAAREHYQSLEKVIEPWRQAWAANGLDDAAGINKVLSLWQWADNKPVEFANWFFEKNNLTIEGGGEGEGDEPEYVDPDIQAIRQENAALKQEIGEIKGTLQARDTQSVQAQQAQIQQEFQNFKDAKDEKGSPLHPYFDEVRRVMAGLIRSGEVSDLETAYASAVRAHPEVSRKIESAAKAAADRERRQSERAKAEAAKRAGASVSGEPSGATVGPELTGDVREDMRREFAERGLL